MPDGTVNFRGMPMRIIGKWDPNYRPGFDRKPATPTTPVAPAVPAGGRSLYTLVSQPTAQSQPALMSNAATAAADAANLRNKSQLVNSFINDPGAGQNSNQPGYRVVG